MIIVAMEYKGVPQSGSTGEKALSTPFQGLFNSITVSAILITNNVSIIRRATLHSKGDLTDISQNE